MSTKVPFWGEGIQHIQALPGLPPLCAPGNSTKRSCSGVRDIWRSPVALWSLGHTGFASGWSLSFRGCGHGKSNCWGCWVCPWVDWLT